MGEPISKPQQESLKVRFDKYVNQVTPLMKGVADAHAVLIASAMQNVEPQIYAAQRRELDRQIRDVEKLTLKYIPELMDAGVRMVTGYGYPVSDIPEVIKRIMDLKAYVVKTGAKLSVRENFSGSYVEGRTVRDGKVLPRDSELEGSVVEGGSEFFLIARTSDGKEIPIVRFYESFESSSIGNFAVYPVDKEDFVPPKSNLGTGVVPHKKLIERFKE